MCKTTFQPISYESSCMLSRRINIFTMIFATEKGYVLCTNVYNLLPNTVVFFSFNLVCQMLNLSYIHDINFKQWWSTIPPISTKSTLTSNHWTRKRTKHLLMKIHVLVWDRNKNMSGLNPSTESLPLFIILLLQTRFYNSIWFLCFLIITNQIL